MENRERTSKIVKKTFAKNLLIYTLIFSGLMVFIICIFSKYGKYFIRRGDGFRQHIVNLTYFRELLVNFFKTGNLSFFTWFIGNGFDLYTNFTYYVIGDFFSYLSILVRTKDIELLYNIIIVLRMYFVGLAFLCYSHYNKMNRISSLIGTLMYAFSSYMLYAGVRHPYFLNSAIIFPFLMIGIEKIIKEDKVVFYTFIVFLTFIVSFYFAYSLSLVIAIYGIFLAIYTYKEEGIKKIIKVLIKTLLFSIIGIMIAGIDLYPTILGFLNSERVSDVTLTPYLDSYYRKLATCLLHLKNTGYWFIIGMQSLILITLPLFIIKKRKEHFPLFMLLMVLLLPILFTQIGSLFVGFKYPNNRWSFVYSFIFAFISTIIINENYSLNKKDILTLLGTFAIFLGLNAIAKNNLNNYVEIQLLLFVIWLIIMYSKKHIEKISKKFNLYNISMLLILVVGISMSIKYIYGIDGHFYVQESEDAFKLDYLVATSEETIPDFYNTVSYIENNDREFYKISKTPYKYINVSLMNHFNSIGYYFSIIPNSYAEINLDLNNNDYYILHGPKEFDYRTKISSLLGTKYLINYKTDNIPYGYTKTSDYNGKSDIYKNKYYLPFGELYTNYITREEYDKLSPLEKESSLLKTTALENNDVPNDFKHFSKEYSKSIKEIDYNLIDKNNIVDDYNNILIKNKSKSSFGIKIDEIKNSEIYISIENLRFEPFTKDEMINLKLTDKLTKMEIAKIQNKYKYYEPYSPYNINVSYKTISKDYVVYEKTNPYYVEKKDFLINLGYYDKTSGEISINLSSIGKYSFDNIKMYAVSMDDYKEDINNLRKSNFEVIEYNNGYLKGKVNAESSGILQFQTMYSDGWEVYLDGKKVDTLKSNKYFLGIEIESGEHEIYMKYSTPYIRAGLLISVAGIILFIILGIYRKKIKK